MATDTKAIGAPSPTDAPVQKPMDESRLFSVREMPYKEVPVPEMPLNDDGSVATVVIQGLRPLDLDEINDVQNRPTKDGKGNVLEEANRIGWDSKVVARALRKPDTRQPMFGVHWMAGAEKVGTMMLPSVVKRLRDEVLELSGFGDGTRSSQKKSS